MDWGKKVLDVGFQASKPTGETESSDRIADSSRRAYARFAGLMYPVVTAIDVAGVVVVSRISGNSNFLDTSHSIAASETLYRIGMSLGLVGSLSTILLSVGLYVTLKSVDGNLAMTALLFRVAESAIGGMAVVFGYATLQIYLEADLTKAFDANQLAALVDLSLRTSALPTGFATVVSAIFSMVGSTIFFSLFLRSEYIPRILAGWGLFASLWCFLAFIASLIVAPSSGLLLGIGGLPIGIAEPVVGLWLLIRGIQTHPSVSQPVGSTA